MVPNRQEGKSFIIIRVIVFTDELNACITHYRSLNSVVFPAKTTNRIPDTLSISCA